MLVFIAISVGLVSIWLLYHALLPLTERGTVTASEWERIEDESIRLLERRDLLIAELRDLEFEAALNKVGDKDLESLRARYEAEALDVVRQLDEQAQAYTDRIDTDVADRIAAAQAKRAAQQAEPVVPPVSKPETSTPQPDAPPEADGATGQVCPACGAGVQPDAHFCDACGTKLGAVCGECGTRNRAGAKFCKGCGAGMEASA
jgi:ribosomal protein L40E